MSNNKIKAANNDDKHNGLQQRNVKNITKIYESKERPAKVYFDISKHLRVLDREVPEADPESAAMSDLKTICDIDNTFYKVIGGRPIRQFVDVKVYMRNLRDITLYRANAAYLKDQIVRIDTNIADELTQYNIIDEFYNKVKTNVFHFLKESYDTALETQQRAEAKSEKLANKVKELDDFSFTHVKLNNKIGSLAAVFGSLFRYGSFLNQMSPIWWLDHYNVTNSKDFAKVFEQAESTPTQSFEIYMDYFIQSSVKPKIFFKKPQQLIRIFDTISRQCLNYMQIQSYFAGIVKPVLKSRDQLEIKILTEMNEVTDLIVFYEQQVKWMEEKETEYNTKFNKLLFKEFYELYASYKSTKLFTCVQYIHFRLFQGPEDPKDNITVLLLNIEKLFVTLTSKLDQLDQDVVKKVKYEVFSSDIKIIKRATIAQRILKECDILKKSLISSFEAPRYFNKKMST